MSQRTFADLGYDVKKRVTRWERVLARMDQLIPWEQLEARIRPIYPKAGRGRRPYPLSTMLRIHCVQLFLQSGRSEDGGSALRSGVVAAVRGPKARGAAAGRDNDSEVPSSAGGAWSGGSAVQGDRFSPTAARPAAEPGDHRGREYPGVAFLDEKQGSGAGSGDAPDEKEKTVVFRHEGPTWRRTPRREWLTRW